MSLTSGRCNEELLSPNSTDIFLVCKSYFASHELKQEISRIHTEQCNAALDVTILTPEQTTYIVCVIGNNKVKAFFTTYITREYELRDDNKMVKIPRIHTIWNVCVGKEYRGKGLSSVIITRYINEYVKDGDSAWLALDIYNPDWDAAVKSYVKIGFANPTVGGKSPENYQLSNTDISLTLYKNGPVTTVPSSQSQHVLAIVNAMRNNMLPQIDIGMMKYNPINILKSITYHGFTVEAVLRALEYNIMGAFNINATLNCAFEIYGFIHINCMDIVKILYTTLLTIASCNLSMHSLIKLSYISSWVYYVVTSTDVDRFNPFELAAMTDMIATSVKSRLHIEVWLAHTTLYGINALVQSGYNVDTIPPTTTITEKLSVIHNKLKNKDHNVMVWIDNFIYEYCDTPISPNDRSVTYESALWDIFNKFRNPEIINPLRVVYFNGTISGVGRLSILGGVVTNILFGEDNTTSLYSKIKQDIDDYKSTPIVNTVWVKLAFSMNTLPDVSLHDIYNLDNLANQNGRFKIELYEDIYRNSDIHDIQTLSR